jgi:hypothetical protein
MGKKLLAAATARAARGRRVGRAALMMKNRIFGSVQS